MTLTSARGPLGPNPAGRFSKPLPDSVVYVEPHPRRVQAMVKGRTVIDTECALLVHRSGHPPAYAFTADDVAALPSTPEPAAAGYFSVPWDAVDEWIEEGRKLVHYPPNPYHRIDCRPTRRRLRVDLNGTTLVDTDDTIIVFETALAPVLYVSPAHVRTDLLHRTDSSSYCNYKGMATYWAVEIDGAVTSDVAWSYEDTLAESAAISTYLSFDPQRVSIVAELPQGTFRQD